MMALLFRTKYGSFSVKDGYCNGVFDAENTRLHESRFHARKLQGIVRENDIGADDLLPVECFEADPSGRYRLVFGEDGSRIITDVVTQFEDQPERMVSLPPPPLPARDTPSMRAPSGMHDLFFPNSVRFNPSSK